MHVLWINLGVSGGLVVTIRRDLKKIVFLHKTACDHSNTAYNAHPLTRQTSPTKH